jgi:TRAP-type C4-dicarboxylate transport system permease small subunit
MTDFIRVTHWSSRMLNWVAGWSLVGMMMLTCADIILRLFRRPILGTYEIVGFLGVMVAAFAMAQTTVERGHVAVEVVVTKFSPRVQKIIYLIIHLLSIVLFAVLAFECVRFGNDLRTSGEVSMTIQLPYFPILYGIAFAAVIVCLVLVIDILMVMTRGAEAWYRWEE